MYILLIQNKECIESTRNQKNCYGFFSVKRVYFWSEIKRYFFTNFQVVCGKCSGQKQPMAFEDNKPCRVCKSCHQVISNRNSEKPSETTEINQSEMHSHPAVQQLISKDTMDVQVRPKGLLEVG